jgi:hypothetical protein
MVALVIVDGTGPILWNDPAEYDKFYHNSFCARLSRAHAPSNYTRGPVVQGTDTKEKGDRALRAALQMTAQPSCKGLVMAGHSRGGAAVIYAAQKLQQQGILVDMMALYDGVDMETGVNGYYIPPNVLHVRHAMRSPAGQSRPYWGNCGVLYDGPGPYESMTFYGTHAAVGGVPWKTAGEDGFIYEAGEPFSTKITIAQDHMASLSVDAFMTSSIMRKIQEIERKPAGSPVSPGAPKVGRPGGPGNGGPGGGDQSHRTPGGVGNKPVAPHTGMDNVQKQAGQASQSSNPNPWVKSQ